MNLSNVKEKKSNLEKAGQAIIFLHGLGGKTKSADFLFHYLEAKGYKIYAPVLLGHDNNFKELHRHYPEDWFRQAEGILDEVCQKHAKVYLVGASFGGNLAMSLAAKHPEKVNGVVTLETPIFFNLKFTFILRTFQPIFELLNIERVSKTGPFYRKNYVKDGHSYEYIPVKTAGRIMDFICQRTKKDLPKIKAPIFVLQAADSDLIRKKSAMYIFDKVGSRIKRVEYLPIDNHDLDLFDEEEKILTMEKVYNFLEKI